MIHASESGLALALADAPATPTGGAQQKWRGWGCGIFLSLASINGAMASADAKFLTVPSGQKITLSEILIDDMPGEIWVRFRFLAPQIGSGAGQIGYDVSAPDMDHLCEAIALPYLEEQELSAARVVVSLSSQMIAFGSSDPSITQFFEAYRPENARCIWEEF